MYISDENYPELVKILASVLAKYHRFGINTEPEKSGDWRIIYLLDDNGNRTTKYIIWDKNDSIDSIYTNISRGPGDKPSPFT